MIAKKSLIILFLLSISFSSFSQKLIQIWDTGQQLNTPESVLYDESRGVIYVSNINENPWEKDGNGFLSTLGPDGSIKNKEWITGLSGPKGLAVVDNKLYVADIDELVEINLDENKVIKKYPADGLTSLNDVTSTADGAIYVSDTNTGKIMALKDGKFTLWYDGGAMGRINGLYAENGKLYVGSDKIYELDLSSKDIKEVQLNCGGIDGLEKDNDGNFVFSNWPGRIFYVQGDQLVKMMDTTKDKINTADIDFAKKLNLLLVPTFFDNRVVAYKIER